MAPTIKNRIHVFWAPHEDLWVNAARKLPLRERRGAFIDIAAMTSRSLRSVERRAQILVAKERAEARAWLSMALKKDWAASGLPEAPARRIFVQTPTMTNHHANRIGRDR